MELKDNKNPATFDDITVKVRNCVKQYTSSNVVLNNFNMTVREGTIYGLLGSSGCGKTTLMKCIVGVTEIDSGSISLKYNRRSDIGYMPEILSLHHEMTIIENFICYGYLFDMTMDDIEHRAKQLISTMSLPESVITSYVKSISGGQQRRISLAIALLHDPKIIILDEPTVGLDPVVSLSIWDYLLYLAENGKTIILTTNYIQEAQRAHMVGFMRNGEMLIEESPDKLLNRYGTRVLDDAFLILSEKQERDRSLKEALRISNQEQEQDRSKTPKYVSLDTSIQCVIPHFDDDKIFSRSKFKGVLYKNIILLRRSQAFLVIQLLLPVVVYVLFNVAVGHKPKNLRIGVVNRETTCFNYPRNFHNNCLLNDYRTYSASCLFLNYMKRMDYDMVGYSHYETGIEELRRNKIWSLLKFSNNYTSALSRRILDGMKTDDDILTNSCIQIWQDASHPYIYNVMRSDIVRSMFEFLNQTISDCGKDPRIFASFVKFEKPVFGSITGTFLSYAVCGFLGACCFYFPILSTFTLTITEKTDGITQRMQIAGVSILEMVSTLFLIQLIVQILQNILALLIAYVIFNNPLQGSSIVLGLLMMITGTSGTLFGYLVGTICSSLALTTNGITSLGFLIFLCSGTLWPVEAAHHIIQSMIWALPIFHVIDAIRGICLKGLLITDIVVLKGFVAAFTWNLIFILMLYEFFKWNSHNNSCWKRKSVLFGLNGRL